MRRILAFPVFLIFSLFFAADFYSGEVISRASERARASVQTKSKNAVLVELFTSQGCLSCPPADRVLTRLEKEQPNGDAEIITLSLHVDYWDSLGWKDEFSSAMFSRRQDIYGHKFRISSIYTPQMVVDGQTQFVGSKIEEAVKAVTENAKNKKAAIELSLTENNLKVKISEVPPHENATVFLAVAEDNLASKVSRGENSGKKLEHTSVVRELKSIGMLLPAQNDFSADAAVQLQPVWKRENLKFVVFVQENQSRKILGVGKIKLQ